MNRPKDAPDIDDLLKKIDLSEIDADAYIEAAIRYNSDYSHWDRVRYRTKEGLDPKIVWAFMKIMRKNNYKHVKIGDLKMNYSLIEEFQKTIHNIDVKAPASILSANGLNEKERKIYSVSSVMEESIASSQMEGAATTTPVAKKMLRENRRPKDGSEQMIVNNYDAMRLIKQLKNKDLTQELIFSVHGEITKNTIEDSAYEGRYRDTDDIAVSDKFTGEVVHEPMGSDEIDKTMEKLCDFVNDEDVFIHPLIKGIIIHYLIGYIHPFVDGNGRTARSLFYWYLLKKGYWIIEFLSLSKAIKKNRTKYDMSYLLSETDENDMTYFIKFNLSKIEEALDDFILYVENKRKEQNELDTKISDHPLLPMRQQMIISDAMRSGRTFSIYEIRSKYQVTYQTARADIMNLEGLGLIEKTGKVSNQVLYSIKNSGKKADEKNKEKRDTTPPEKVRGSDSFFE
jgi:Fic family protein